MISLIETLMGQKLHRTPTSSNILMGNKEMEATPLAKMVELEEEARDEVTIVQFVKFAVSMVTLLLFAIRFEKKFSPALEMVEEMEATLVILTIIIHLHF